ncbi:MAG: hypothetical protein ABR587_12750 [Candidatus Binatia bacterium]
MFQVSYEEARRVVVLRRELDPSLVDVPERRLMVALVADAVRCIEKYRTASDSRSKARFAKEVQWMLSDEKDSLFAFIRVCEILDLDPVAVRCSLGISLEGDDDGYSRSTTAVRPAVAGEFSC